MNIKQQSHYAAYYNMARRNIFVTLTHIAKLTGLYSKTEDNKENSLRDMRVISILNTNTQPEERLRIERLLYKHLPFLRPAVENRRIKSKTIAKDTRLLYNVISDWCYVITYYRDKYSHLRFNDERTNKAAYIEAEERVVNDLNEVFTASCRIIKERFSLSTQLEFLTKNRYINKTLRDKDGRPVKDKDGKVVIVPIINHNFFYSIQDHKGRLKDNIGIIFFLCQFIEKKYASRLFDQQGYKGYGIYENHNENRRHYIREVFSAYRIKLPRERLDVERNDTMLAMDMLNEVRRCPAELFDIIPPAEQERFRIVSATTKEEVLIRRSSDRFTTLALEYLDNTYAFNKIRFQVSLGKYRYKFYNKTCIDGNSHIRSLQKELNGFGRINEINQKRLEVWRDLLRQHEDIERDTAETEAYITDHNAQYIINSNRIGIYFNNHTFKALQYGMYLPPIHTDKAPCIQPVCHLSTYEIPAMLFHYLLTKDSKDGATEHIIIDKVENYHRLFTDIANGTLQPSGNTDNDFANILSKYGIKRTHIPRELQDYITGKGRYDFNQKARTKIKEMIYENDRLLKQFRKQCDTILSGQMKYGKHNYTEIRSGRLASFLAQDIVYFMPHNEDKPTGKNFSVLQATLATFNTCHNANAWDDIKQLLIELGAIGREKAEDNHPFIDELFEVEISDTTQFYKLYLEKRGKYLRKIFKTQQYTVHPFLHATRTRHQQRDTQFYRDLAARYTVQPIELPRGIFEEAIKELLSNYTGLTDDLAREQCNVTHLIARYMEIVMGDNSQPFYFAPRHYRCLAEKGIYLDLTQRQAITQEMARKQYYQTHIKPNKDKTEKEIEILFNTYYRQMQDNERTLRRYRIQDMLLYLAAKDIIKGIVKEDFGHRLRMVADENNTAFFDYKMPYFSTEITLSDGRKCRLKQNDLKLKHYGDFFRFIYDTRVRTLLDQTTICEIDRNILEQELTAYDECRPEVFETLLHIEQHVLKKNPQLEGSRITFLSILTAMENCEETQKEVIRLIRNAFSHNTYPQYIANIDYNKVPKVAESLKDLLLSIKQ